MVMILDFALSLSGIRNWSRFPVVDVGSWKHIFGNVNEEK
jgi:hypothetical protein